MTLYENKSYVKKLLEEKWRPTGCDPDQIKWAKFLAVSCALYSLRDMKMLLKKMLGKA